MKGGRCERKQTLGEGSTDRQGPRTVCRRPRCGRGDAREVYSAEGSGYPQAVDLPPGKSASGQESHRGKPGSIRPIAGSQSDDDSFLGTRLAPALPDRTPLSRRNRNVSAALSRTYYRGRNAHKRDKPGRSDRCKSKSSKARNASSSTPIQSPLTTNITPGAAHLPSLARWTKPPSMRTGNSGQADDFGRSSRRHQKQTPPFAVGSAVCGPLTKRRQLSPESKDASLTEAARATACTIGRRYGNTPRKVGVVPRDAAV
jgi:hypothetical protein